MANSSGSSGGVSIVGILTIIFIVLKLVDVIDWSWIWVLSPIWISLGGLLIILIIVYLISKLF